MNGSLLDNTILTLDAASPGVGPIAPTTVNKESPRSDTYLSIDHNIRSKVDNNFIPMINAQNVSSQNYVNDKYVNFTGRGQIYPTVVQQINLKGENIFSNNSIYNPDVTTKQTTDFSYAGNAERESEGTNFYRYDDKPKVTTNQTTLYSHSGNAARGSDGTNFYRYDDKPKVTTKQTTDFSFSGNVNGTNISNNPTNRVQYTGNEYIITNKNGNIEIIKSADSGVTKWGQKDLTLVEDYFPGPSGTQNIQLDPLEKIGNTELTADWLDINVNGTGSYNQSVINAEHFQQISKDFIGNIEFNPNKIESVDNRQTANYLVDNFLNNPFSIYQKMDDRNKPVDINFFIDQNSQNYSGISTVPMTFKYNKEQDESINAVKVFKNSSYNPNTIITNNIFNQLNDNIENTFLYQHKKPNNSAQFMGLGYPGSAIKANSSKDKILLNTDSILSSRYLDNFMPNGCLNNKCY